jgi:Flp pilus assembly pilin Flp
MPDASLAIWACKVGINLAVGTAVYRLSQSILNPTKENGMNLVSRLIREEEGMEMIEWAIVGVVFAVAAAAFWGQLSTSVEGALDDIAAEVSTPAV